MNVITLCVLMQMTIPSVLSAHDAPDLFQLAVYSILNAMRHDDPLAFQHILYPIIEDRGSLPTDLVRALMVQSTDVPFAEYFIRTATRSIFDTCVEFDDVDHTIVRHSDDIWKLFKMLGHFRLLNDVFVSRIVFGPRDNKFHVKTKPIGSSLKIRISESAKMQIMHMDWSQIPRFVDKMHVIYQSLSFQHVDLSSIDSACSLQSLIIHMVNGFIILPDYALPRALKSLELRGPPHGLYGDSKLTEYKKLWMVGRHLVNLTIYQPNSRLLQESDFDGLENMLQLQRITVNLDSETADRVRKRLSERKLIGGIPTFVLGSGTIEEPPLTRFERSFWERLRHAWIAQLICFLVITLVVSVVLCIFLVPN